MDISAMFRSAVEEFDARVRLIGDHQWQAATPDEDWSVRDLVNHVVGEDLWAPPLLAGSTIAEVGDRFDGDVLAGDPKAVWAAASAGAVQAVGEDGAMDRIVHLSFGDFPGREYVLQLFADHLIHAWDLARAIGSDERLDARLIASCATWFDALEDAYRSAGDRAAAAGARRRGRPDRAAGTFRAQCMTSDQETSVDSRSRSPALAGRCISPAAARPASASPVAARRCRGSRSASWRVLTCSGQRLEGWPHAH